MPLQRSTHDAPVDIPAIPATIQPGDVVDWPHPIAGFVVVEPPKPDTHKTTRKRAAAPAATEEEVTGDDAAL